jgi:hypothetical protein
MRIDACAAQRSSVVRGGTVSCPIMLLLRSGLLPLCSVLAALLSSAAAAVTMPSIFGDGMVLQTNNEYGSRAFLNGFAAPGERVKISGSGSYEVTADAEGAWSVMINPHGSSSEPSVTLTVQGETGPALSASGCMFGDVFICSGGEEMLVPTKEIANATAEMATASSYPLMRLFTAAPATAAAPARNISSSLGWVPLTPQSVSEFSALCFLTARQVGVQGNVHPTEYDKTKRPMGLVLAAAAGAPLSSWTADEAAETAPTHYNAMVAPLKFLSIRAAFFAHGAGTGEVPSGGSAAAVAEEYAHSLTAVIQSWRALMPVGDFGFNIVQLGRAPTAMPLEAVTAVRLAQARVLPAATNGSCGVGVAVSYDVRSDDVATIADRLALATLHGTKKRESLAPADLHTQCTQ